MKSSLTQPHAQIRPQPDGSILAESSHFQVLVAPEPGEAARAWNRNGLRKHLRTGETEHLRWLVAELDGVRIYVQGDQIVITTRDLYP